MLMDGAGSISQKAVAGGAGVKGGVKGAAWVGPHVYVWIDFIALGQHSVHNTAAELGSVGEVARGCDRGAGHGWSAQPPTGVGSGLARSRRKVE